jgi:hypothetical protein
MRAPLDPAYVHDQYEAMRHEALLPDSVGSRAHGLALFLSRGMPEWLAALSILDDRCHVPRGAEDFDPAGIPKLTPGARSELTQVWAGMVLACTQEPAR